VLALARSATGRLADLLPPRLKMMPVPASPYTGRVRLHFNTNTKFCGSASHCYGTYRGGKLEIGASGWTPPSSLYTASHAANHFI